MRSKTKKIILYLLAFNFFLAWNSFGQNKDTLPALPFISYPFDQEFPLKYTPPSKIKVSSVSLFGLDKEGCLQDLHPKKCKTQDILGLELTYNRIGNDSSISINMPQLLPDKRYLLIISSIINVEGINKVMENLRLGRDSDAKYLYDSLQTKNLRIVNNPFLVECSNCKPDTFQITDYDEFKKFYFNKLKDTYDSIVAYTKNTDSLSKKSLDLCSPTLGNVDTTCLTEILNFAEKCTTCGDTLFSYQNFLSKETFYQLVLNSNRLTNEILFAGYSTIIDNSIVINKDNFTLIDRVKNLTISTQALKSYLNFLYSLQVKNRIKLLPRYISQIQEIETCFEKNTIAIQSRISQIEEINKVIVKNQTNLSQLLSNYDGLSLPVFNGATNTFTFNFETRSAYWVQSDFGFMAYGNPSVSSTLRGFGPYLGFHINFRPLNTDVPFNSIRRKNILSYLSFNAGVLLTSVKEEGKTDGLVGNSAIFTGLGLSCFSHWIRLTGGALWYRKESLNPLITHKSTVATAYVSLSFDLRVKKIYDNLKKIFEQ